MMEIRLRSSVSRTSKGFSVESTLDIGGEIVGADAVGLLINEGAPLVDELSAFQIAKLTEHMKKIGDVFPREE